MIPFYKYKTNLASAKVTKAMLCQNGGTKGFGVLARTSLHLKVKYLKAMRISSWFVQLLFCSVSSMNMFLCHYTLLSSSEGVFQTWEYQIVASGKMTDYERFRRNVFGTHWAASSEDETSYLRVGSQL